MINRICLYVILFGSIFSCSCIAPSAVEQRNPQSAIKFLPSWGAEMRENAYFIHVYYLEGKKEHDVSIRASFVEKRNGKKHLTNLLVVQDDKILPEILSEDRLAEIRFILEKAAQSEEVFELYSLALSYCFEHLCELFQKLTIKAEMQARSKSQEEQEKINQEISIREDFIRRFKIYIGNYMLGARPSDVCKNAQEILKLLEMYRPGHHPHPEIVRDTPKSTSTDNPE